MKNGGQTTQVDISIEILWLFFFVIPRYSLIFPWKSPSNHHGNPHLFDAEIPKLSKVPTEIGWFDGTCGGFHIYIYIYTLAQWVK